jgi:sialic acid synthase SpsE
MKIGSREIGPDYLPYVVAEISSNHGGSVKTACETMDAAMDVGADAIKIQCYTAEKLCANDGYVLESGLWKGKRLFDLYKEAETPPDMVRELFKYAKTKNIPLFSSVFDFSGVDLVSSLDSIALKISSFELIDTPLIRYAASTGLPVIISTGMATSREIIDAINAYNAGSLSSVSNLALLHCVSDYPADPAGTNLPALGPLKSLLGGRHEVGFSDHTLGIGTACGAVSFGASIIEKHFIIDRAIGGSDAAFSMEPVEFGQMIAACKDVWYSTRPSRPRAPNASLRKSLHVLETVRAGDPFSEKNVGILRPATGLSPCFWSSVLQGAATQDLEPYTPLQPSMVSTLC